MFQPKTRGEIKVNIGVIQLMNEAEYLMNKNFGDRGGCYPLRP